MRLLGRESKVDSFDGDIMNVVSMPTKKINVNSVYGEFRNPPKHPNEHTKEQDAESFIRYLEFIGIELKLYQKEMIKVLVERGEIIDRNSRHFTFKPEQYDLGKGIVLPTVYFDEFDPFISTDPYLHMVRPSKPNLYMFITNSFHNKLIGNYACFYHDISSSLLNDTLTELFILEMKFKRKMSITERIKLDIVTIIRNSMIKSMAFFKPKKNYDTKLILKSSEMV